MPLSSTHIRIDIFIGTFTRGIRIGIVYIGGCGGGLGHFFVSGLFCLVCILSFSLPPLISSWFLRGERSYCNAPLPLGSPRRVCSRSIGGSVQGAHRVAGGKEVVKDKNHGSQKSSRINISSIVGIPQKKRFSVGIPRSRDVPTHILGTRKLGNSLNGFKTAHRGISRRSPSRAYFYPWYAGV